MGMENGNASECAASDGDFGIGSVALALIYANDVDAREEEEGESCYERKRGTSRSGKSSDIDRNDILDHKS